MLQRNVAQTKINLQKARVHNAQRHMQDRLRKLRLLHAISTMSAYFHVRRQCKLTAAFQRWQVQTESSKNLDKLAAFRIEMTTSHYTNLVEAGQLQRVQKRLALKIMHIRTLENQYAILRQQLREIVQGAHGVSYRTGQLLQLNKRHLCGSPADYIKLKRESESILKQIDELTTPQVLQLAGGFSSSRTGSTPAAHSATQRPADPQPVAGGSFAQITSEVTSTYNVKSQESSRPQVVKISLNDLDGD